MRLTGNQSLIESHQHQTSHRLRQHQQLHQPLKLLQQMHLQLLEAHQLQLDQMFSQLQFNQLQAIPIFIQQTH
jgi:hypothetical protein